MNNNNRR